jgi:hypothetical protein
VRRIRVYETDGLDGYDVGVGVRYGLEDDTSCLRTLGYLIEKRNIEEGGRRSICYTYSSRWISKVDGYLLYHLCLDHGYEQLRSVSHRQA